MFYHDKKEHMSPSAFDQFHRQRSAFVKSYFEGEKGPETGAMRTGKQIHKLIEAGIIPAKWVYGVNEETLKVQVPGTDFYFLGIPDSRTTEEESKEQAAFVDYKSGKANDWKDKLPTDLKMKATAWLVWMVTGQPGSVRGAIEFIQTTWNPDTKEVEPVDGKETEVIDIIYSGEELKAFTQVIADTMNQVNELYEKWLKKDTSFIKREDIEEYESLHLKKEALEAEMNEVKDRILSQMEFGGVMSHKSEGGTFSITEKRTYTYPQALKVNYLDYGLVLEDVEAIEAATKAAKKNYELVTEPASTSMSIRFTPKREKKPRA